jgi:HlyD family secretion protein
VPEAYADDLVAGQQVDVRYGAERYRAEIAAVSPEVTDNQVRARARVTGDLPPGIRQNQRVSATVLLERKPDALFVQRGPFLDEGGGRVAYVVSGDLARRRAIQTGSSSISAVEILTGLEEGETIVISGAEDFRSADTVLLTD